jgi:dihydrofolate synthase/folylpolyglutamate synthase
MTAYDDCLQRMYALRRFGIKLGLETIGGMLTALDNPHAAYPCIHIAGTNGKGSVAATLASVLQTAGFRVGLYTSPHLVRFNERICVDGRPVSDAEVADACRDLWDIQGGEREPTFFEYTTAMALHLFRQRRVEWAVVETGMGGRLDATNVLAPAVSVITNLSIEHKMYLGDTLAAIAYEKAGIIKPDTPVVTGVRQKKALAVVRKAAADRNAPLYRLGEAFRCRRAGHGRFTFFGRRHTWRRLASSLTGDFQVENTALALAVCEVLQEKGVALSESDVRKGLAETRWPGRLEVVSRNPFLLLDGAHNLAAARKLAAHLATLKGRHRITLVIGILDDKPYRAILNLLVPVADRVIFTAAQNERALPAAALAAAVPGLEGEIRETVSAALAHALAVNPAGGLVCVAGSLYVVGEAKAALAAGLISSRQTNA